MRDIVEPVASLHPVPSWHLKYIFVYLVPWIDLVCSVDFTSGSCQYKAEGFCSVLILCSATLRWKFLLVKRHWPKPFCLECHTTFRLPHRWRWELNDQVQVFHVFSLFMFFFPVIYFGLRWHPLIQGSKLCVISYFHFVHLKQCGSVVWCVLLCWQIAHIFWPVYLREYQVLVFAPESVWSVWQQELNS